ncbi:hypothetical protein F4703DRAFT_1372257 [Phycomyces blakesleeanus]
MVEPPVTHYTFALHPRNRAIVNILNKNTGKLCFIKVRHRIEDLYAISLICADTFKIKSETQLQNPSVRKRPLTIHGNIDKEVVVRDSSRLGFEWQFEWENTKFCWYMADTVNTVATNTSITLNFS